MNFDETEAMLPAIADFYDGPTQVLLRVVPRKAERPTSGKQWEQGLSMQEPGHSVIAWQPIAIFLGIFVFYAWVLWFGVMNINAILYVVLVEWKR